MTLISQLFMFCNGSISLEGHPFLLVNFYVDFTVVLMTLEIGAVEECLMHWPNFLQVSLMHINKLLNLGTCMLVICILLELMVSFCVLSSLF